MNNYDIGDVFILKVGHHGSKTSSSEEFINSVNPKYSIISVGQWVRIINLVILIKKYWTL